MASNGVNGHSSGSYALPESHKQLMEAPLTQLDPEIAEIMVRTTRRCVEFAE